MLEGGSRLSTVKWWGEKDPVRPGQAVPAGVFSHQKLPRCEKHWAVLSASSLRREVDFLAGLVAHGFAKEQTA